MREERIYPVSAVNAYVKRMLTMDPILSDLAVRGEISNFKRHSSGHLYLTLKDASGAISAVMFAADARRLRFYPSDGDQVIVRGNVSLYEKTGQYQFYIRSMEKEGAGDLYQAFEFLKQKLEKEGLFDPARKKPIPAFPRKIGVVTSPTGAALRDVTQIARRRFPGVQLVLYPALVQGSGAAATLVRGLQMLDHLPEVDVIILCRGGGSIEDLWPFNEEMVARAIAGCVTPVISGVGHETDFTIADFVSDLRAPTPSAAAELAVTDVFSVLQQMKDKERRRIRALAGTGSVLRTRLSSLSGRLALLSPERKLRDHYLALEDQTERQQMLIRDRVVNLRHRLEKMDQVLVLSSPLHQMEKGYAFVTDDQGNMINSTAQTRAGAELRIQMMDGTLDASVQRILKESWDDNE